MLEDIHTGVEAFYVGTFDSSFICGAPRRAERPPVTARESGWEYRESCSSVKLMSSHNATIFARYTNHTSWLAIQFVVRYLPFPTVTLAKVPCFPANYDYCKWSFEYIVIFASLRAGARPWPWWHGCEMNARLWLISVSLGIKHVVPFNRAHAFIAPVYSRVSNKHSASVTTRPIVKYLETYALFCIRELPNVPVTTLCAIQFLTFVGLKTPSSLLDKRVTSLLNNRDCDQAFVYFT